MPRKWSRWALVGALVLTGAWWGWQRPSPSIDRARLEAPRAVVARADASSSAGIRSDADSGTPAPTGFQTLLLPDGGIGARADSVRIGLGLISTEDARSYQDWLEAGSQGAGPAERSELATVERWLAVPATRRADGALLVGPLPLPWADRYDLQARGEDGLHFYLASRP